ncbi:hypothetical protein [Mycoplasma yeatsii]|uniref:hypothetical protein n=1 Tax=Mycoplasma yeatsii TaxID=51365 RepID=UPI0005B30C8F|nr:hypothetical protein [Mycoplasma yeatsii]
MIIFGIIYVVPIISISCLFTSNIPKNFKFKKSAFSVFIFCLIATLSVFVVAYIWFFAKFPQFEDTNYIPPLHELLQYILYNILGLSLFLYWFISSTDLIRTERKINFIMLIKEVILPLICPIIFIVLKINEINNFQLVTLYLICIWISIMVFEHFIWNFIWFFINLFYKWYKSSSVPSEPDSIRESTVENYIEDTVAEKENEEFVITDSKNTKYREKENTHINNYDEYYEVIEYVLSNNPEDMENVAKKFETSLENIEKYLKEYLCNNSKNDKTNVLTKFFIKIYNKFILRWANKIKNKQKKGKEINISRYISMFKYSFVIIELILLLSSFLIFYLRLTSNVNLLIPIFSVFGFSLIGIMGIGWNLFNKKKLIINSTDFRFFLIINILTFNIISLIWIIIIDVKIRTLTIFQNYMKTLNKTKTKENK